MRLSQFCGALAAMASLPIAFFVMFWGCRAIAWLTGNENYMYLMWLLLGVWPLAPIFAYGVVEYAIRRLFPRASQWTGTGTGGAGAGFPVVTKGAADDRPATSAR